MKSIGMRDIRIQTEVALFTDEQCVIIGHLVAIPRTFRSDGLFADKVDYVGYAHDWDTEGTEYDPIAIGVFSDPEELRAEVEVRARFAEGHSQLEV